MYSGTELSLAAGALRQEAEGLLALADGLDSSFLEIADVLLNTNGHIAVTGVGKSGYVARKAAATFSSTGSPAYFLPPLDASHGDLGMLRDDDCLLAFSNSGNSRELINLVTYAERKGLPSIGVTSNSQSWLARHVRHALIMPPWREADPINCAPTSSTTMQMALADALAVVLMARKGYSLENYHLTHPGGSLGARLLLVDEIMRAGPDMPILPVSAGMTEAILLMTGSGLGVTGIVDNDCLIGIITDGDLRRHIGPDLLEKQVLEVMHPNPIVVRSGSLVKDALRLMRNKGIIAVFVVDEGNAPLGFLNVHDCLRAGVE